MRTMVLLLILVLATPMACAMSYLGHDPQKILTVSENASGQKAYGLDMRYLDHMLGDLSRHAGRYPPSFDSKDQKQRAIQDLHALSGMLGLLLKDNKPNPQILYRSAMANRMSHNLDIHGAAKKAEQQFQELLKLEPDAPQGNYQYGIFLAETGRVELSIPYLDKALALGLEEANYSLGMAYLGMNDKREALARLNAYLKHNPTDRAIQRLVQSIQVSKFEK